MLNAVRGKGNEQRLDRALATGKRYVANMEAAGVKERRGGGYNRTKVPRNVYMGLADNPIKTRRQGIPQSTALGLANG